jgi:hypothetical protein
MGVASLVAAENGGYTAWGRGTMLDQIRAEYSEGINHRDSTLGEDIRERKGRDEVVI